MQNRYIEAGQTVKSSDVNKMNEILFTPALVKGGNLSLIGDRISFAPGSLILPNGIIVNETESREMVFANTAWKTIFYKYDTDTVLGGKVLQLMCKEGVYTQEELELTSNGDNIYTTVVAWAQKTAAGTYELIRPNNDLYTHYKMDINDYEYNKLSGKSLLDVVDNPGSVVLLSSTLGTVDVIPYDPITTNLEQTSDITMTIPFSVEALGTIVIDRKGNSGSELKLEFLSLDGKIDTTVWSLTGLFECKETATTEFNNYNTLKTTADETDFTRFVIRPTQTKLDDTDTTHGSLPRFGVLRLTIPKPSLGVGSDGNQYLRAIGFSKYNVPSIDN